MIIYNNGTIGSFLLHLFALICHPYPPSLIFIFVSIRWLSHFLVLYYFRYPGNMLQTRPHPRMRRGNIYMTERVEQNNDHAQQKPIGRSARETEFRGPGTATSERELAIDSALPQRAPKRWGRASPDVELGIELANHPGNRVCPGIPETCFKLPDFVRGLNQLIMYHSACSARTPLAVYMHPISACAYAFNMRAHVRRTPLTCDTSS